MLTREPQEQIKRQAKQNLGDTGIYDPVEFLQEIARLTVIAERALAQPPAQPAPGSAESE